MTWCTYVLNIHRNMELDEEFNIFDDCDELFDINDTELCAEQTDDKKHDNLLDVTARGVEELDLLESLNSLEIDKPDCSVTSVIKYGDSPKRPDNTDINENSDDNVFHPSISLSLYSLIINNFTINMADTCSIAINSITQAICFISNSEENKFRLDIHVNGITKYERFGKLIQIQLRNNIRKWIIPVRRIIDKDNIEISVDPTDGEIYKSNMILATVPIVMNYQTSRYHYDVPIQLTLREFTIIMQNKLSIELLSGNFEYRYANNGIIGIRDEEDWENFKEVMKRNYGFNSIINKERIEMWVGKD
ncbi:hypothetical protein RclHR1_05950015 [Rhizophagus clarus]|uniref:Uncharacterized protein n=1 Tax=Rhizophagus clarus TaxID=94130 RepID=A0A2Z6RRK2_9GLOM|nr:hypothetical protein RclHR1_05950015 [Rhizophagus clarus]